MGTVSAIVSAYYAEEFIERRLDNLKAQIPTPEIVVIAQMGTLEYKAAYDRGCTLVGTTGVPSLYDAWNMGIRCAHGEYITNANSDDVLYPGALSIMAKLLDENPDIALCYADSDVVKEYGGDPVNRLVWMEGGWEEVKKSCFIGSMPMWRADLHSKYGFFDEQMKSAGDYEFWLRITSQGERIQHIPQALGAYLVREDSIYHKRPLLSIWESARARSRYIHEL